MQQLSLGLLQKPLGPDFLLWVNAAKHKHSQPITARGPAGAAACSSYHVALVMPLAETLWTNQMPPQEQLSFHFCFGKVPQKAPSADCSQHHHFYKQPWGDHFLPIQPGRYLLRSG